MKLNIRQEKISDHKAVHEIIAAAFAEIKQSDQSEPFLVNRLRKSPAFVPELSLVAALDGQLVGHIILTKLKIVESDQCVESLALAPVSVFPTNQKCGIGTALIEAAHVQARGLEFRSVILLGHAEYYPRFGYRLLEEFGIRLPFDAPAENCMAIELVEDGLKGVKGKVVYPTAFWE